MHEVLNRLSAVLAEPSKGELVECFSGKESLPSRRVFHGRGHCFTGLEWLSVDLYDPVVLITLFAAPNECVRAEETTESAGQRFSQFLSVLASMLSGSGFTCIALQHRYRSPVKTEWVLGQAPNELFAIEEQQKFHINIGANQNIGFFLDAAPARQWVRQNAEGKKVLNLFAYTCSFSVAAIAGGASRVFNIDMSRNAIRTGEDNHRLNFTEQEVRQRAKFLPYEVFRSISRLAKWGPFDLIIIDPPSFQAGSFVARKDYSKLVRKLPRLLRKGGQVLACLNAPNLPESFLLDCFSENAPTLSFNGRLDNSKDFPDVDASRSLKLMVFTDS